MTANYHAEYSYFLRFYFIVYFFNFLCICWELQPPFYKNILIPCNLLERDLTVVSIYLTCFSSTQIFFPIANPDAAVSIASPTKISPFETYIEWMFAKLVLPNEN